MDEGLIEQLQQSGLTRNEAKAYLVLLSYPGSSGGDVGKRASIDRSLAYTLLNNLIDKGLVSSAADKTRKLFYANDPENLLNPLQLQQEYVRTLIPLLHAVRPKKVEHQEFRVYEGVEGMKAYARLILTQRSVLSFGGTGKFYDIMSQHAPHLMRKTLGQFKDGRVIGSAALHAHPLNAKLGFQSRLLPITSPATTVICDDFVAIHLITEKPFAVIIYNREIV